MDFQVPKKYDALTGRFKRELLTNDIVNIATSGTIGAVGSTVAFTVITSSFDFYVTGIYTMNPANVVREVNIMGGGGSATGTSTLMTIVAGPFQSGTNTLTPVILIGSRAAPLLKITGPSTVSIGALAGTTGSFAAAIWGVREPVMGSVETF